MSLRLVNKSEWRTVDLKRFVLAGLRALGASESKTVEIKRLPRCLGRGTVGRDSGYGFREGGWIALDPGCAWREPSEKFPPPDGALGRSMRFGVSGRGRIVPGRMEFHLDAMPESALMRLAGTLAHEVGHNLGLHHRDMGTNCSADTDESRIAWARGLAIRSKPIKAKPTRDMRLAALATERHAKAIRMVDKWTRRAKLTGTVLKKWKRKVAYYERKAAAMKAGAP